MPRRKWSGVSPATWALSVAKSQLRTGAKTMTVPANPVPEDAAIVLRTRTPTAHGFNPGAVTQCARPRSALLACGRARVTRCRLIPYVGTDSGAEVTLSRVEFSVQRQMWVYKGRHRVNVPGCRPAWGRCPLSWTNKPRVEDAIPGTSIVGADVAGVRCRNAGARHARHIPEDGPLPCRARPWPHGSAVWQESLTNGVGMPVPEGERAAGPAGRRAQGPSGRSTGCGSSGPGVPR